MLDRLNLAPLANVLPLQASFKLGQRDGLWDHAGAAYLSRVRDWVIEVLLSHLNVVQALEAALERGKVLDVLGQNKLIRLPVLFKFLHQGKRCRLLVVDGSITRIVPPPSNVTSSAESFPNLAEFFLLVQLLIDIFHLPNQDCLAFESFRFPPFYASAKVRFVADHFRDVSVRRLHFGGDDGLHLLDGILVVFVLLLDQLEPTLVPLIILKPGTNAGWSRPHRRVSPYRIMCHARHLLDPSRVIVSLQESFLHRHSI